MPLHPLIAVPSLIPTGVSRVGSPEDQVLNPAVVPPKHSILATGSPADTIALRWVRLLIRSCTTKTCWT